MFTGSIPLTGISMPFVSAGGTSLSVFMGAIGILCNVGRNKDSSISLGKKSFFDLKGLGNKVSNKKKDKAKI